MTTHQMPDVDVRRQAEEPASVTGVISTFTNNCEVDLHLGTIQTSTGHHMSIRGDDKWNEQAHTLKPGGQVTMSVSGLKESDESAFGHVMIKVQNTDDAGGEFRWQSDRGRSPQVWTRSRYDVTANGQCTVTGLDRDGRVVLANLRDGHRRDVTSTESRYALWAYYNWEIFSSAQPGPKPPPPEPGTKVTVTPEFRQEFEDGWGENKAYVYSHRLSIAAGPQPIRTWELRFFLPEGLSLHKAWLGTGQVIDTSKGRMVTIRHEGHLEPNQVLPVDFHLAADHKDESYRTLVEPTGYRVN